MMPDGDQFNKFEKVPVSHKCQLYILLLKVTKHCTQWNKVYRDIDRFVKIDVYMVLLLSSCTTSKTCKKLWQQNKLDWN